MVSMDGNLYMCNECKLHYIEKESAERCEAWCRGHNSCNLEITSASEEARRGRNLKNREDEKIGFV